MCGRAEVPQPDASNHEELEMSRPNRAMGGTRRDFGSGIDPSVPAVGATVPNEASE